MAACLLFSFIGTGSSFLAYATIAEKTGIDPSFKGKKSIYYLGGLTEGTILRQSLFYAPYVFGRNILVFWQLYLACYVFSP